LFPHLRVIPHFDRFLARMPDIAARVIASPSEGVTVIGIDEETAIIGGPERWDVRGRQSAWVLDAEGRTEFARGSTILTPGAP
jgi:cyanophycinase-like exopeptidase